jgi:hypothetical protein
MSRTTSFKFSTRAGTIFDKYLLVLIWLYHRTLDNKQLEIKFGAIPHAHMQNVYIIPNLSARKKLKEKRHMKESTSG